MDDVVRRASAYAAEALAAAAEPGRAAPMQAYMKTDMPFYGVPQPARTPILRDLVREFRPADRAGYERLVLGLWSGEHREEKYLALGLARAFGEFVVPASLPLYRRLVVEGAWWDLVDEVATHLVRDVVVAHPDEAWAQVDLWADDGVLWLRRAAILCQVGARHRTDPERLFGFCAARAHEPEFFIRKAIGWALRDYAKTDPEAVAEFVTTHRDRLSPLSYREATKHIGRLVAGA